jgi:hypothetical protein
MKKFIMGEVRGEEAFNDIDQALSIIKLSEMHLCQNCTFYRSVSDDLEHYHMDDNLLLFVNVAGFCLKSLFADAAKNKSDKIPEMTIDELLNRDDTPLLGKLDSCTDFHPSAESMNTIRYHLSIVQVGINYGQQQLRESVKLIQQKLVLKSPVCGDISCVCPHAKQSKISEEFIN